MMQNFPSNRQTMFNIYSVLIFIYVVSAIAFECTPNTARIATIAIYALFFAGVGYLYLHRKIKVNMYIMFIIVMSMYVYSRAFSVMTSAATGMRTAYVFLTCCALCAVVFWLSLRYREVIHAILAASIVGSLVLVCRIIVAYGGIAEILSRASNTGAEFRVGKLLANENAIGIFLAGAVLAGVTTLLLKKRTMLYKILLCICIVIFTIMLLLTGSRKALLFAAIGVVFLLTLVYRKAEILKKLFLWFMIAGVVVGLVYLLRSVPIFGTIYKRFEMLFETLFGETIYKSDEVREYMIEAGIKDFLDIPLFGKGAGRSYTLFRTYSHNNFVELLMNYGVIGFLLYYIPYLALLVRLTKMSFRGDVYAMYFLVYVVMQLVLGVGWVNYYDRICQLTTAAAWGYITSCFEKEENVQAEGEESFQAL